MSVTSFLTISFPFGEESIACLAESLIFESAPSPYLATSENFSLPIDDSNLTASSSCS